MPVRRRCRRAAGPSRPALPDARYRWSRPSAGAPPPRTPQGRAPPLPACGCISGTDRAGAWNVPDRPRMFDEEGDGRIVPVEAVMPGEGRDGDLVVERDLLALLGRGHGERDAQRLLPVDVAIVQGARPPAGSRPGRRDFFVGKAGVPAEIRNHLEMVVRLVARLRNGHQPFLLGHVLRDHPPDVRRSAPVEKAEGRHDIVHEFQMLGHVDAERAQRQRTVEHGLKERVLLGVPTLADGDDPVGNALRADDDRSFRHGVSSSCFRRQ